ncbi:hypothetical protein B0H66DRAFT_297052 [Apodospora peruviana]|uniref:Zn(2)-C6 fungal-type domain-containing protein n=1 Tax=Apodospora peruviana TaxID=516989 RepID=A0AAE0I0U1_9PEZI|nr:hypothetical protein B0H66DRAFT_297052 [Apodospora peruviana]
MDQLETQVSDLRSFLGGGGGPGPAGPTQLQATAPPASATSTPQHVAVHAHRQSLFSAPYGDNSAQNSPALSPPPGLFHSTPGRGAKRARSQAAGGDVSDDGSTKQQRAKRNRYISIACNECKRRKIKCNGQSPCDRCGKLNLQCLYSPNCCTNFKDSDEFKQVTSQLSHLQEQVDALSNSMKALRQETVRLAPIQDRILPPLPSATATPSPSNASIPPFPKPLPALRVPPSFSGPTSIAFTVDVAKNTLHNMGYSGGDISSEDNGVNNQNEPTPHPSPNIPPMLPRSPFPRPPDPLWEFDKDEMIRLCRLHEEEIGIMYPVIKMDSVIEHARFVATWMDSARRHGLATLHGQDDGIAGHQTLILKIVMCCALTVEEHGNSARAAQLYESIQPVVDKTLMSDSADVTKLPFLALVGGYRFLSNDEILAWRVMGQVARLCLELGLHRREGLQKIADEQDRKNALNTFWSAYVLDRRWSFMTGLPFVCHDDKIDPKLPYPEEYPYLVAMITYSKLGAKIWKLVDYFEPAVIRELKHHDFEELDRQILEWYDSVPEEVKVGSLDRDQIPMPTAGSPSYDLQRQQIWTRLRLNQIRIWLYTPVLHSAISIVENMSLAQKAVDLAKETIRYLAELHNTTNLYRRIQVFYHQFLTSAIAVLFLASTHAPLQFSANCRGEFHMALELVKDMSARSWVSKRLWKTIGSLKAYALRLGLEEDSSTNLNMHGMADSSPGSSHHFGSSTTGRSNVSTPAQQQQQQQQHQLQHQQQQQYQQQQMGEDPSNGLRLQSELGKIFEGYLGMGGIPNLLQLQQQQQNNMYSSPDMGQGRGSDSIQGVLSPGLGEVGVYQQLKDMF